MLRFLEKTDAKKRKIIINRFWTWMGIFVSEFVISFAVRLAAEAGLIPGFHFYALLVALGAFLLYLAVAFLTPLFWCKKKTVFRRYIQVVLPPYAALLFVGVIDGLLIRTSFGIRFSRWLMIPMRLLCGNNIELIWYSYLLTYPVLAGVLLLSFLVIRYRAKHKELTIKDKYATALREQKKK